MTNQEPSKLNLKRELGLTSAISLIAGIMIGSGIFMSPQYVISNVGSPGASLITWAVCGLVTMGAALCYLELGTIYKESGAEYIYLLRIYGPLPAFFIAYTYIIVMKPSSLAAQALGLSQYALAPVYTDCSPPTLVVKCIAVVCILLLGIVNMMNVRFTMAIQVIFLIAKVVALIVIVIGGVVTIVQNGFEILVDTDLAFKDTNLRISTIGIALYQGLWSYSGWGSLNFVIEEVKKPLVRV